MNLAKFVIKNIPHSLREVQQRQLTDALLNVYEIALIYHYTDTGFESLNDIMVQNNGLLTTPYAKYLSATLQKLPSYQDVVFRGTTLNLLQKKRYIKAFQQSEIIQESYFLSTSKSQLVANQFSKRDTGFIIFSKSGKEIEKFSKFGLYSGQNEQEVLFEPNCSFEVLEISQTDSQTLIILEQIL